METRRRLRTPQAAEYVNLSVSTLEKKRVEGTGPPYQKVGPKIVVYRPEDLDAWVDANTRRSTSDNGPTGAGGGDDTQTATPGDVQRQQAPARLAHSQTEGATAASLATRKCRKRRRRQPPPIAARIVTD
jgi:predicted DNA-binding transcriptional regulator AlpA